MPFLHSRSIDWSALTSVRAIRKNTVELAEGVRDALSRIQSAFDQHRETIPVLVFFIAGDFASADATRGLSNRHLDPFGIVIPSTHFKSIIVNSPNHHAKGCAND